MRRSPPSRSKRSPVLLATFVAVAAIACGGSNASTPPAAASGGALAAASANAPPPRDEVPSAREAVAVTRAYAERICACDTPACAKEASEAFAAEAERFRDTKGSEADARDIEASVKKALACSERIKSENP
jgi:hypothetical protein